MFERRTSTGSGLFKLFGRDFEKIPQQIVFIRVTTLGNTNLVGQMKREKLSLPVAVRLSITSLLKLPMLTCRTLIVICDSWNSEIKKYDMKITY